MTEPHLKVNASFYFKDRPEEYRGITQINYNFGDGDEPFTFSELVHAFTYRLLSFYIQTMNPGIVEVREQLASTREMLSKLDVEEKQ